MTDKMSAPLHVVTPMVKSVPLSQWLPGCDVYLKMESSQVSGSFKMRGIAYRCQKAVQRGSTHLVGASGGNAGLALACAARLLNVPCTVYVPVTTPQITVNRLKSEGANVVVHGTNFSIANERALQEAEKPGVSFVHAYNHPEIWEGHASIMDEAAAQLPSKPSVIVLSVGGGGLMSGVLQGLHNVGWADVPVVAMETYGAHCFNMSVNAKRVEPLDSITSIATSLGARTVPDELMATLSNFNVTSEVVTDAQAVSSCLQFADGEKTVVEPACGAALAAVYHGVLSRLEQEGHLDLKSGPVLVVVCGGSVVSLALLQQWGVKLGVSFPGQHNYKNEVANNSWTTTVLSSEKCV
ncbi:L-serine dehydratase/L-threonine deaminase isoform X2 [Anabrus simplex]|uniref:L-serine dehydratase/L-threonine deaminase isoform X2 n=1 Tax=Anabrus simplex TaxID=316456 RepID=UPI0035A2F5C0